MEEQEALETEGDITDFQTRTKTGLMLSFLKETVLTTFPYCELCPEGLVPVLIWPHQEGLLWGSLNQQV